MKALNTIAYRKHTIGIIFGILAAVVILGTETFYYDYVASYSIEIPSDEDDHTSEILTIGQDAVSTVVEYTLDQVLHFISEIYTQGAETLSVVFEDDSDFNTLFKTLFRLIISPNAP